MLVSLRTLDGGGGGAVVFVAVVVVVVALLGSGAVDAMFALLLKALAG